MIHDNICNIENYKTNLKLYSALVALKQFVNNEAYDKKSVASFSKAECSTRYMSEAKMENHHKYIDIHYVIRGEEKILVSSTEELVRVTGFSEENDCELFEIPEDAESVKLQEGDFLVVYPGESHAPKNAIGDELKIITKVVAKV